MPRPGDLSGSQLASTLPTFIVNEVLALERRGVDLVVFSGAIG